MSLVSSWIYATDGAWYGDPSYRDPDGNWFLCFDDDEPPELVVKAGKPAPVLEWFEGGKPFTRGERFFEKDSYKHEPAYSIFGQLICAPPPPDKWDERREGPIDLDLQVYCVRWLAPEQRTALARERNTAAVIRMRHFKPGDTGWGVE